MEKVLEDAKGGKMLDITEPEVKDIPGLASKLREVIRKEAEGGQNIT